MFFHGEHEPFGALRALHFLGHLVSLLPEKDAGVFVNEKVETSKIAIGVKTPAGKSEDGSSIPRTLRVE